MAVPVPGIHSKPSHYPGEIARRQKAEMAIKASYVFLQMSDLLLTMIGVSLGFCEVNIIMRNMLASPGQLILIKLVIPLFIAWLVPGRLLVPAILLLSLVVGWDIKELVMLLF